MLKFVDSGGHPIGPKRKQSQRACLDCRQKKRRCQHPDASNVHRLRSESEPAVTDNHQTGGWPQVQPILRLDGSAPGASADIQAESTQRSDTLDSRFIGDLNPESLLLSDSGAGVGQTRSSTSNIGIWLSERLQRIESASHPNELLELPPSSLFYGFSPAVQRALVPILQSECLGVLPPPSDLNALCGFYFERISPVIPIIDKKIFAELASGSPERVVMQQTLCLASSVNSTSRQHLRLSERGPLESPKDFAKKLVGAIRVSIESGFVTSTTVKIRALVLVSLFLDRAEGQDLSAMLRGSAVHYVHSIGLHIQGKPSEDDGRDEREAVSLLCCVWALDRLTAAFHGRPILMHERDMGRNLQECFKKQPPCFRLFLEIIDILEKVIQQYRPVKEGEPGRIDMEFPTFETMVIECNGLQIPASLLATVEIMYHAVAILSCRGSRSDRLDTRAASSVRQSLSASRVTSACQKDNFNDLVLLPFVPYAVSLSLSVAYREMRNTRIPMYRLRAREQLQENCKILENLGDRFWSASVMADMGNATLKEFDRVYSSLQRSRPGNNDRDATIDLAEDGILHNPGLSTDGVTQSPLTTSRVADGALVSSSDGPEQRRLSFDVFNNEFSTACNTAPDSDWQFPNDMAGLDLFEMFDPAFGLSGIDACLQGNLDLQFPFHSHNDTIPF